jgi:alpha-mannosidase
LVPEHIYDIPMNGSLIHLRSNVIGSATMVYIDGKKVFQERAWADMQIPEVTLTEKASAGSSFEILVWLQNPNHRESEPERSDNQHSEARSAAAWSTAAQRNKGVTCRIRLDVEAVEDILFELETFFSEMDFCSLFSKQKKTLEKAKAAAEARITKESQWSDDLSSIQQIRELLAPLSRFTKEHTVHLIGHAHIDMNWLWTMEDTIDVCRRDFTTMVDIMDEYPDFRFSQSQGSVYRIAEEHFPKLFEKMRRHIEAGGWDMSTAATWTENDLNMSSGESTVRHLLHTRRFMSERFGKKPLVCWQPDTFGHPATVPQILKKAGVRYYFHMRCTPGHRLYRWVGLDGSEIITYNHTYNGTVRADRIIALSRQLWAENGLKDAMMVYGVGDHGGGPTRRDIKRMRRLNELPTLPRLVFSTPKDYFQRIEEKKTTLPLVRGELNTIFEGCYTTHADIKERNRRCEQTLLNTEASAGLTSIVFGSGETASGGSPAGAVKDVIDRGWEAVLFNQFHDILCGCAIRETYVLAREQLDGVLQDAGGFLADNLRKMSARIGHRRSGMPIVVWNLQGFSRTDVTSMSAPGGDSRFQIINPQGETVPSQVFRGRIFFLASDVPAMGYKTFYMVPADAHPGEKGEAESGISDLESAAAEDSSEDILRIENRLYTLEVDRDSGCFQRFFDKGLHRDLINRRPWLANSAAAYQRNFANNCFRVDYEIPQSMAAWIIGPILRTERLLRGATVELKDSGKVMDVVEVNHAFGKSVISQEIYLYRDLRRIDFHTRVDWKEESDEQVGAPMLKAEYSLELSGENRACAEIPFGHIRRPADGMEYPCQRWVDISGDDYGFALLNDGKYGYSASGSTVALTCLRTSHNPDPTADRCEHFFRYSLFPHRGGVQDAEVTKAAAGFSDPLVVIAISPEDGGEKRSGKTALSEYHSWINVDGKGVMLSALKPSESGNGLVVRLYETNGETAAVSVDLAFPVSRVEELDLVEEGTLSRLELTGGGFRDRLKAFEIKTYLLVMDG